MLVLLMYFQQTHFVFASSCQNWYDDGELSSTSAAGSSPSSSRPGTYVSRVHAKFCGWSQSREMLTVTSSASDFEVVAERASPSQ